MCNKVVRRLRRGLMIDAEQLEEVAEYKYLRRLITSSNEMNKEIEQRITLGWRRFGEYSHFLKDSNLIPICLNRKILDTVILPVMTYGAEMRTLTNLQERKMAVAQWSLERSLLNITNRDEVRNEVTRSKTKVVGIIDKVQCMRGQWAGHIARMSNTSLTRWAKITSEWTPREGRRARGRPKRRWRDSIEEVGSSQWMRVTQDRSAWPEVWPSASSGMNGWDHRWSGPSLGRVGGVSRTPPPFWLTDHAEFAAHFGFLSDN